jgi:hypothetical protein
MSWIKYYFGAAAVIIVILTVVMTPMIIVEYLHDHNHPLAAAIVGFGSLVFGGAAVLTFMEKFSRKQKP